MQVWEAQSTTRWTQKRPTPRYIISKISKVKDKESILKAAREKLLVTHKGISVRLSADFSK